MLLVDGVTDDLLLLIHEFCEHPFQIYGTRDGRCNCGISSANRRLRDLFRYRLMHLPILASSLPELVASHERVVEVVFTGLDDNVLETLDADWSLLLYLRDAPRPGTLHPRGYLPTIAPPHLRMHHALLVEGIPRGVHRRPVAHTPSSLVVGNTTPHPPFAGSRNCPSSPTTSTGTPASRCVITSCQPSLPFDFNGCNWTSPAAPRRRTVSSFRRHPTRPPPSSAWSTSDCLRASQRGPWLCTPTTPTTSRRSASCI